jgi:class 3 adenylate cyclase
VADDTGQGPESVSATELRTFLIADVRGYTRFTREQGDEAASELAAWFAEIVRGAVPAFGGELLELRGDEALCVFGSARQALRAAVELQRRLRTPSGEDGRVLDDRRKSTVIGVCRPGYSCSINAALRASNSSGVRTPASRS